MNWFTEYESENRAYARMYPVVFVKGKNAKQWDEGGEAIANDSFEHGLLFGPCGVGGQVLKLIPPLTIPEDGLLGSLNVLTECIHRQLEVVPC